MIQKSAKFWILLVISLFLATLVISVVLKIIKAAFFLLLLLIITPIIYIILKNFFTSGKNPNRSDKLKSRD